MTNSIRVESKTNYTIEVNDNGDIIAIDLSDVGFYDRLLDTVDKVSVTNEEYKLKAKEIDAMDDDIMHDNEVTSQKDYKKIKLLNEYFNESRKAIDDLFGEGTSQKVFGNAKRVDMFEDFFEQLEPHFKKMGKGFQNYQKDLKKKYASRKNKSTVLKA